MAATRTRQQSRSREQKTVRRDIHPKSQPPNVDVKTHIINLLGEQGALTRGEITTLTGIPRTTVYDTLMNLLLSDVIEKYVERNGRRGRPAVYYQLL